MSSLSIFTKHSLTTAFEIAGFEVESIHNIFQEQYIWLEAKLGNRQVHNIRTSQEKIYTLANQYAKKEMLLIQNWQKHLKKLCLSGKVG